MCWRSIEQSCSLSRWMNSLSDTHWFGSSQDWCFELPYFWLSLLCLGSPSSNWQLNDSKMGTTGTNGYVCWTFTLTCCKCCFDFQSPYRTCISMVSCHFWRWLYYSPLLTHGHYPTILGRFGSFILKIAHIYQKTELTLGTWQSLPELILENSDFASEQTEVPNAILGTHTNDAAS